MAGLKEEVVPETGKVRVVQGSYDCTICQQTYQDRGSNWYHMTNAHAIGNYKCDACPGEQCNFPGEMQDHIKNFHRVR